jgi:glycosyltransferase involved in cell wall biosynthesis
MADGRPWPRISIVTPSYNQGQFIEETVRSALLQGYPNLEYIIIDGGSTDDSVKIIRRYEGWLVHWTSEPDRGQADAINKGFCRATGKILGWLNSDDLMERSTLDAVSNFWIDNPSVHFLTGDGEIVDSTGKGVIYSIRPRQYSLLELLQFHKGKYLPQPSVFFSREALLEAGGLKAEFSYSMDLDLWLRIRGRHRLYYLSRSLSRLRRHEEAKTQRYEDRAVEETWRVILNHLTLVRPLRRVLVRLGINLFYACTLCRRGLMHYFSLQHREALAYLWLAVRTHPGVVVLPEGLKLWLRLLLPLSLRRGLFKRP